MAEITWTESALNDLDNIAEYIALNNIQAAQQLVKTVFETVERLADFPNSGRIPPELEQLPYREVIVGPCRVIYRPDTNQVYILCIFRHEQQLRQNIITQRDTDW